MTECPTSPRATSPRWHGSTEKAASCSDYMRHLWPTRWILVYSFLTIAPLAMVFTILPDTMIDYFASQAQGAAYHSARDPLVLGYDQVRCETGAECTAIPQALCAFKNGTCTALSLRCENFQLCGEGNGAKARAAAGCVYTVSVQPQACLDAAGYSGQVGSTVDSVTNIVVFLTSPMIGAASDSVGRRPVLLGLATLPLLPSVALVLYAYVPISHFGHIWSQKVCRPSSWPLELRWRTLLI